MKKTKLEELETVNFTIKKRAFEPETLRCSKCNQKMRKSDIEMSLEGGVGIKLSGFECPKCRKRYLGLNEARKLDKAVVISRFMKDDFKIERSLSYDGDNFTFRIPKEFTHDVSKRKVEIMPLGAKQFCVSIE